MKITKPTAIERILILGVQFVYLGMYKSMYWLAPYTAHRMVGYLEECAVDAYNDYLNAIDAGKIENKPAPNIAKRYYRLKDDATIRDVVLHVRADECMHRDFNHMLSSKHIDKNGINEEPTHMADDLRWTESISNDRLSNLIEDKDKN